MNTAWMIRNDGNAIPVEWHVYTLEDDLEQAVEVGEWLSHYSNHEDVKKLLADFHEGVIADFQYFNTLLKTELNQEFLRARYGGMYDTDPESKEMVFRISSIGFNWYGMIADFVKKSPFPIETITIVRDRESTGVKEGFYKTCDGRKVYRKIPIAEFFAENENLQMQKKHLYYREETSRETLQCFFDMLEGGASIQSLKEIKITPIRLAQWISVLIRKENKLCSI